MPVFASAVEVVLVNEPFSENDRRYDYPQKLLSHILNITEKEYGSAIIKQATEPMSRDRTLIELKRGASIHVMAEAPKPGWERDLIPIRIPIRKGIQGYRIFLIDKKNQPMLSKISTLSQLKKIATGSGQQWSTTRVLKENGFNVKEGASYEGLFNMLVRGRFVTFGRGINEAFIEFERHSNKFSALAVEQDLLLYIPLPTYFFVAPTKPDLAKRIESGLLVMISDGSFDKLFLEEFGDQIQEARLAHRRMFSIGNPNLSPETPLNIKKYWYHPDATLP